MRRPSPIRAIFGLELRGLLRDPRTLFVSVVLPVVLIPVLLLGSAWLEDRRTQQADTRIYRVAITGPDSTFAAGLLTDVLHNRGDADGGGNRRFRRVGVEDGVRALASDSVDVVLEAWPGHPPEGTEGFNAPDLSGEMDFGEFDAGEPDGVRVLRVRFHSDRTASREGADRLLDRLERARELRRDSMLVAAGFPGPPDGVAELERVSIAPEETIAGARVGQLLTLVLMGLMVMGGSVVATDTLAGEKERGTLMTLLTSAASRTEIVTGKLLATMAVALGIAIVQVVNLWIFLGLGIIDPARTFAITVSPALAVGLFLLYLPMVGLTAGILLLTSAHARTYKEAQLYLTPVVVGLLAPTLAPLLPDLALHSAILLVPIANISIAARDLLVGQVSLPGFAGAWVVTAAAAVWVTTRSVRALHDEGVVTGTVSREEFAGGPLLFPKRVIRWFLVLWAAKVLLDLNVPVDDIRLAILVHVGLVFTIFPLLVIRRFRLDPRDALALRRPQGGVWVGVLIGAPAAFLVATSLFRLIDLVLPVPTELLEGFGQSLFPEGIPLWQVILLASLVPAISEELTFRGVLLHGLRRRFGPIGLALVVGLIFGFFHFQIFRIPVTAFLGVVLTAVTLLSGSIFPAMLWHAVNNALALYLGSLELDPAAFGWGSGLAGAAMLAVAFGIIWRFRSPLPGVGRGTGDPGDQRRDSPSNPRDPTAEPGRGEAGAGDSTVPSPGVLNRETGRATARPANPEGPGGSRTFPSEE